MGADVVEQAPEGGLTAQELEAMERDAIEEVSAAALRHGNRLPARSGKKRLLQRIAGLRLGLALDDTEEETPVEVVLSPASIAALAEDAMMAWRNATSALALLGRGGRSDGDDGMLQLRGKAAAAGEVIGSLEAAHGLESERPVPIWFHPTAVAWLKSRSEEVEDPDAHDRAFQHAVRSILSGGEIEALEADAFVDAEVALEAAMNRLPEGDAHASLSFALEGIRSAQKDLGRQAEGEKAVSA